MNLSIILEHMNEHHLAELLGLVKHYGGFEAKEAKLTNVTEDGMYIQSEGKEIFAPFPTKTDSQNYKDAIIALCSTISKKNDQIADEVNTFKKEFNTVLLATLSKDNKPHVSYSPLLRYQDEYYIYVSEVAPHCQHLKDNQDSVQVMFIEDEDKAKTILARKRVTYDVSVEFLPRNDFYNQVFDSFEERVGKIAGMTQVRMMDDFHLLKVNFKNGRYVKGFGQAYEIDNQGNLCHVRGDSNGMPHKMANKN